MKTLTIWLIASNCQVKKSVSTYNDKVHVEEGKACWSTDSIKKKGAYVLHVVFQYAKQNIAISNKYTFMYF